MSIPFPALPYTAVAKPRLVRYGSDLTPALGGPVARINRLGSRFAVDINLPTFDRDVGPTWIAARLAADSQNVTNTLIIPSAYYDAANNAYINGGGQAGTNLSVAGLPANATIPPLIPFSFSDGTRNYLHMTTAEITTTGSGAAVLSIAPMLRTTPGAGTALNFEEPLIEGFCTGSTIDWELQLARFHKISFTLTENA